MFVLCVCVCVCALLFLLSLLAVLWCSAFTVVVVAMQTMQNANNINCYNHRTPKHHYSNLALLVHTHDKSMQTHCNSQCNTTIQPHTKQCPSKKQIFENNLHASCRVSFWGCTNVLLNGVLHVLVDRNLRDMHHVFNFCFWQSPSFWSLRCPLTCAYAYQTIWQTNCRSHVHQSSNACVVCVLGCSCCCLVFFDVLLSL